MALYNELLAGRFNEALVKLFGMKQPAPAPQLAGEVSPVLDITAPPPETRYLGQERLWGGFATAPAAAGQKSAVNFNNPAGSNIVAVVERIYLWSPTGAVGAFVGLTTGTTSGTLGEIYVRDSRLILGNYPVATAIQLNQTNAGITPPAKSMSLIIGATACLVIETPFVVCPGSRVYCVTNPDNTSIVASFEWRERALLTSEL